MRKETLEEIAESYQCGNISWTKSKVKKMSKYDFLTFAITCQSLYGTDLEEIARLAL